MGKQLRMISKEEAHKLIDEIPGDEVLILMYENAIGISDHGQYIKKKRGKKYVDKSKSLGLVDNRPVMMLNLHDKLIQDFSGYNKEDIVRLTIKSQV